METIKTTKNILIPFEGFYNTSASDRVENIAFWNYLSEKGIQEDAEHERLDIPDDLTESEQADFWDNYYPEHVDEIRKETATAYIDALAGELGIKLTFESIDSPRQYNYTTDRLFCDADEAELLHLYNRTDKEILAEVIKERHTSGPGFDSFYDNEITAESWQNPEKYDHNQWQTVIEANIKQNGVELSELYYI